MMMTNFAAVGEEGNFAAVGEEGVTLLSTLNPCTHVGSNGRQIYHYYHYHYH